MTSRAVIRANEQIVKWHLIAIRNELPALEFNMRSFEGTSCINDREYTCGTSRCIGGWLWLRMNFGEVASDPTEHKNFLNVSSNFFNRLKSLFYVYLPSGEMAPVDLREITVRQAQKAIDNFINGAKYPWKGVVK